MFTPFFSFGSGGGGAALPPGSLGSLTLGDLPKLVFSTPGDTGTQDITQYLDPAAASVTLKTWNSSYNLGTGYDVVFTFAPVFYPGEHLSATSITLTINGTASIAASGSPPIPALASLTATAAANSPGLAWTETFWSSLTSINLSSCSAWATNISNSVATYINSWGTSGGTVTFPSGAQPATAGVMTLTIPTNGAASYGDYFQFYDLDDSQKTFFLTDSSGNSWGSWAADGVNVFEIVVPDPSDAANVALQTAAALNTYSASIQGFSSATGDDVGMVVTLQVQTLDTTNASNSGAFAGMTASGGGVQATSDVTALRGRGWTVNNAA